MNAADLRPDPKAAADLIVEALLAAQADAVTPKARDYYTAALIVARESGVLFTAKGEPVAALLDDLHTVTPTPKSEKVSAVWQRSLKHVNRPRYRFHGWHAGARILDTQTGAARIWREDDGAAEIRAAFANTDSGAVVTEAGIGVCGLHESLAADLLAKAPIR
jgi:hypothetical protein